MSNATSLLIHLVIIVPLVMYIFKTRKISVDNCLIDDFVEATVKQNFIETL